MQGRREEDEEIKSNEEELQEEMNIDTSELFRLSDIIEATKASNFNKGFIPDCFDGNVL